MPKSKLSTRSERPKRNHRDSSQEREAQKQSDGVVDEELDELDTDKYEPAVDRRTRGS